MPGGVPALRLPATNGDVIDLATLGRGGRSILYCYPLTGRPGTDLPEGWDAVDRLHLPFAMLSDPGFRLAGSLGLPTFTAGGTRLYKAPHAGHQGRPGRARLLPRLPATPSPCPAWSACGGWFWLALSQMTGI